MRKNTLHLIPAALLLLCSACKTPTKSSSELPTTSSSFLQEEIKKETASLSPNIWNVADIDLSDVDKRRKLISFTFDDSPARSLENLLAVFAEFNESNPDCPATATLFVNGGRVDEQNVHLLHAALALGWELGNHTQSHKKLTTLNEEEIKREIAATDTLLQGIDGKDSHLLRAPFGAVNERVQSTANVPLIDWTIDTLDWTGLDEGEIYERIWKEKFSGAIVLMHDGYEGSVSALKQLLPDLKKAGYQVVSVSKMIKAHGCVFQRGKVYIRARPTKSL